MELEVVPTEKIEVLKDNLEKRVEKVEIREDSLMIETEEPEKLSMVPGVEKVKHGENEDKGIGGSPVDTPAYAKIEDREDAVRCLIATVEGYDIRVLQTERNWDLRQLRKYNPDIKHLKAEKPIGTLGIEYSLSDMEDTEKVDIEMPEKARIEEIYREKLT